MLDGHFNCVCLASRVWIKHTNISEYRRRYHLLILSVLPKTLLQYLQEVRGPWVARCRVFGSDVHNRPIGSHEPAVGIELSVLR